MPRPDQRRVWRWAELATLLAVALWALVFQLRLPGRLPTEADHRAAAAHLGAHARPGDVVVLWPWWTERARLFLPEGLTVHGYQGVEQDDFTAAPRIWVLAQPSLPRAGVTAFEDAFLPGRLRSGEAVRFGPLELTLYENRRHRPVLFSAADALQRATVYVEGPAGRLPCRFDGRAHRCPGGATAATEWHEVRFEPRRCVFVPPPAGARLVAEFADVPAAAALVLEAGFTWDRGFHHGPQLTPAFVRVETGAGGPPLLDVAVPVGQEGLQRGEVTGTAPGLLRLSVEARNPELRDLCVDLFAYGPEAAR